jgi:hypothetical protein
MLVLTGPMIGPSSVGAYEIATPGQERRVELETLCSELSHALPKVAA